MLDKLTSRFKLEEVLELLANFPTIQARVDKVITWVIRFKKRSSFFSGTLIGALLGFYLGDFSPEFMAIASLVVLTPIFFLEAKYQLLGEGWLLNFSTALYGSLIGTLIGSAQAIVTDAFNDVGISVEYVVSTSRSITFALIGALGGTWLGSLAQSITNQVLGFSSSVTLPRNAVWPDFSAYRGFR